MDRGTANKEAAKLIETLKNPNGVFFATLGMYADSDHARESIEKASELLPNKEALVDGFVCQGKIDPKVIEIDVYKRQIQDICLVISLGGHNEPVGTYKAYHNPV